MLAFRTTPVLDQMDIDEAVVRGASNIHFEPYEKEFRVRYRIDGVLSGIMRPPPRFKDGVIDRVKFMAKLDIAEKRLPQEGRISVRFGERDLDLGVSTIPVSYGENVFLYSRPTRGTPLLFGPKSFYCAYLHLDKHTPEIDLDRLTR